MIPNELDYALQLMREGKPTIHLTRWQIYLTHTGSYHVIGDQQDASGPRVSRPLVSLDQAARTVTTTSGRTYHLEGVTGQSEHAQKLWKYFCANRGIDSFEDVSNDLAAVQSELGCPD